MTFNSRFLVNTLLPSSTPVLYLKVKLCFEQQHWAQVILVNIIFNSTELRCNLQSPGCKQCFQHWIGPAARGWSSGSSDHWCLWWRKTARWGRSPARHTYGKPAPSCRPFCKPNQSRAMQQDQTILKVLRRECEGVNAMWAAGQYTGQEPLRTGWHLVLPSVSPLKKQQRDHVNQKHLSCNSWHAPLTRTLPRRCFTAGLFSMRRLASSCTLSRSLEDLASCNI